MKRVGALLLTTAFGAASTNAWAIEGAAEDTVTTHAVSIATGGPSSPKVRCSGTLISPNLVLTVRHCITHLLPVGGTPCKQTTFAEPPGAPSDLWVDATPWSRPSTSWRNVASWVSPEPTTFCGNDIALLVLATPFTEAEATPATPVLSAAEFELAVKGRALGLAAFGSTSVSAADAGTRRSRFDVPIRCVPGIPGFACEGALEYIDVHEFTGGAGPCSGDSGAGAMLPTNRGAIFGVLSRGDLAAGTCAEGIYERTDVWRWLIAKTALLTPPRGGSAPAWARDAFPTRPRAGDLCLGEGTCESDAECVSFDARRSFVCAKLCAAGCGEGHHCESKVCAPGAPLAVDEGGCTVARTKADGSRTNDLAALVLALLVTSRIVAVQRTLATRRR